ncbi:hypothetical protein BCR34DRAFT_604363 [Clohesyomyces aquaticus]|uniref:Uncharacterized protein n=1 Tax=Clohesyomyces aquaticus TaxID=1231657 RepID=A0A1Y1Z6R6_9PLEO|nr:hypothetical protein BCR34DRAFT_604363 [Clohesyomyces aquaticus]
MSDEIQISPYGYGYSIDEKSGTFGLVATQTESMAGESPESSIKRSAHETSTPKTPTPKTPTPKTCVPKKGTRKKGTSKQDTLKKATTKKDGVKKSIIATTRANPKSYHAPREPGNPDDTKSFLKTNKWGPLRDIFEWLKTRSLKSPRNSIALAQLRECGGEFAGDKDVDPLKRYKNEEQETVKKHKILAHLTMRTFFRIQAKGLTQKDQDHCKTGFNQHVSPAHPTLKISILKFPQLVSPETQSKESIYEACNRILCLFAYIRYSANKTTWTTRFGVTKWNDSSLVAFSHVPIWIRSGKTFSRNLGQSFVEDQNAVSNEPPLTIEVRWLAKAKNLDLQSHMDLIEENGLVLPSNLQQLTIPHSFENTMQIRDSIRRLFNLQTLQGQIATLTLKVEQEEENIILNIAMEPWNSIKTTLKRYCSGPNLPRLQFTSRIRQENEGVFEWNRLPAGIEDFLTTEDNDVSPAKETTNEDTSKAADHAENLIDKYVFEKLCLQQDLPIIDKAIKQFRKRVLSEELAKKLDDAAAAGRLAALYMEKDSEVETDLSSQLRYLNLQGAMTETAKQVGFPIELSAKALWIERGAESKVEMYKMVKEGAVKRSFFPYQVNGAVWVLTVLFGEIPTHPNAPKDVLQEGEKLVALHTMGGFVNDRTSLGKTILLRLILRYSMYRVFRDAKGKTIFKPKFLCPELVNSFMG